MDDSGVLSIINQVTRQGQAATGALPAILSQAAQSGTTPDQEAQWQRLAKESNVPVGLIRNGAPVRLMQLQQQAAELPATNPVTARTLMNPDNAAVAHDDIPTLTQLEDLARNGFGSDGSAPVSTLQFGTARDRAEANYLAREYGQKPFQSLQGGTGKLATKLAFPLAAAVDAVNGDDDYKEFASQLYDKFSEIQKQSAADPGQGFGGRLFRSLEELAPMVMSGGFGLGNIVGQAVNEKYDDLTAKGVDPDTATALALKAGMSAYAMTKLPFGGTSLANSLVRGATLNPAFGVLDRALDKAGLRYAGYDKEASVIDLADPEQIAHDMALGLLFGTQHAIETGRPIVRDSALESLLPFYDTYRAARRADTLQSIGDTVQESKLGRRDPDLLQQHLQQVGEENGIDQVYVPVNCWNTLFRDAGMDPATAAGTFLSNPESYLEALTTGADIPIPYGEFAGRLSAVKNVYPELVKDTRLGIGEATLREAEQAQAALREKAEQGGGLLDALKGIMGRSGDTLTQADSFAKVYDDVFSQLTLTGTEKSQADTNARLMANAFRVLGERAGVDPFELYRGYNLKLSSPDAVSDLEKKASRQRSGSQNPGELLAEFEKDKEPGTGERAGASSIAESDSPIRQALLDDILHQDTPNVKRGLVRSSQSDDSANIQLVSRDASDAHDFVKAPDGRYVFGEITPEIGRMIRRQSAPILLRKGNEQEGKIHIERPERLKQLQDAGYGSAEELIDSVVTGCDAIYQGQKGNLLLVKKNGRNSVAYIQLTPSVHGDFYDVKTAAVVRGDYFDKKKPLWERAQTNPPDNGSPMRDLSGQSSSLENILHQSGENVKRGLIRLDSNRNLGIGPDSKPYDVHALLRAAVNLLASDEVKELYLSDKATRKKGKKTKRSPDAGLDLPDDMDELLAILKDLLFPGSEAAGPEPSDKDISSFISHASRYTDEHGHTRNIGDDRDERTASDTPVDGNDHVKKVATGVLHSAITRIETPADAAHVAFPLTRRAQEAAIAIVTDAEGNVLGVVQHSTGSLESTPLTPRDLLGVVHDFPRAAEVWFAHNHPSGDPSLSPADRETTSQLAALLDGSGIRSRGQVIVGQRGGAVWTEGKGGRNERIPLSALNLDQERNKKIKTYEREIVKLPSSVPLFYKRQTVDYAKSLGDGASGIIIVDTKIRPITFVPMSVDDMAKLKTGDTKTGSSSIMSAFHKANGAGMILFAPVFPKRHAAIRNMASFNEMFGGILYDVIETESGRSFREDGSIPQGSGHFSQGDRRGYIRFNNERHFEIGMLKDADLSTFIHESGHFFTEVLGDLAERPDAPRQIRDDYAALLKFVGVDSRDAIRTEHHEKLARAFEAYIREGRAPSVEMRSLFQRMKAWMIGVYKDMTELRVQLDPEVRSVFDRMMATDSEIERMRDMQNMRPLFASAADAGMSRNEFGLYRKNAGQAGELAKEQLLRTLMAEKGRELERYGDMMPDGSIHEQALKEVHNDAQGEVMRAELLAIRRKVEKVRHPEERDFLHRFIPPVGFFKIAAKEAIGAKRVAEEIQPHLYSRAEGKAARESSEAMAREEYQRAGEAKYRELLNHYLYKEAAEAMMNQNR